MSRARDQSTSITLGQMRPELAWFWSITVMGPARQRRRAGGNPRGGQGAVCRSLDGLQGGPAGLGFQRALTYIPAHVAYASQETAATFSIGEENENLDPGDIDDRDMRPSYWNCPRSRSERPVGSRQSNVRSTSDSKSNISTKSSRKSENESPWSTQDSAVSRSRRRMYSDRSKSCWSNARSVRFV